MGIKLGNNTISTIKLGSNQVSKLYLGSNELWSNYVSYSITPTLSNVYADSNNPTSIGTGETKTLTYYTTSDYTLPATVSVSGATATWSVVNIYTITATLSNATASSSNPTTIDQNGTATLVYTFDGTSYKCPTTAPTITGATGSWTKNSDTQGTLVLSSPTGNVSYTISGEAEIVGDTYVFSSSVDPMIQSSYSSSLTTENVSFACNGTTYSYMKLQRYGWSGSTTINQIYYGETKVYGWDSTASDYIWFDNSYKTITISNLSSASSDLQEFITINATKQNATETITALTASDVSKVGNWRTSYGYESDPIAWTRVLDPDTSKVYSLYINGGRSICYFEYENGTWVANNIGKFYTDSGMYTKPYAQIIITASTSSYFEFYLGGTSFYQQKIIIYDAYIGKCTRRLSVGELTSLVVISDIIPDYAYSCLAEGTMVALADGSEKPIEDITYDDDIAVWNFYEGKLDSAKPCWVKKKEIIDEYCLATFSDGSQVKFVGKGGVLGYHRIYNDEYKKFTYIGPEVPEINANTHTYNIKGEYPTIVSMEIIHEPIAFYNVGTTKHINLFANGILTSSRISNKYAIDGMKYVGERLISEQEEQEYINDKLSISI